MRNLSIAAAALIVVLSASCGGGGGPTEKEIVGSLQDQLRFVSGDWTGISTAPTGIRFEFRLQENGGGQVSGTGTMKEDSAPNAVPITISGTFQQPALALTFDGMVFEGRQVKGVVQGSYTNVGGIGSTMTLTAPGYTRDITVLLQEK